MTIIFISRYNKTQVKVRLSNEKAEQLFDNEYYAPMELYHRDCERVSEGIEPRYFSKAQINKLDNHLSGIDVWETIEKN